MAAPIAVDAEVDTALQQVEHALRDLDAAMPDSPFKRRCLGN